MPGKRRSITVAITGASGALYATRTVAALLTQGIDVDLITTDFGRRLLRDELGEEANVEKIVPFLEATYRTELRSATVTLHSNRDASGQRQPSVSRNGHRPVLDEDAGRRGAWSVAQPRRAGR